MIGFMLAILYVALVTLPLGLAFLQGKPARPFGDELASGLAMAGFAMLLVEFVLSGRFRTISGHIGIDLTMRLHQFAARIALVFLVVHPFLYSTPLDRARPWDVTGQLTLGLDAASLATGIVAWVVMAVVTVMAIFRDELPFTYEAWRLGHGIGAVTLAVGGTHHAIVAGRYSGSAGLQEFWLVLLGLALLSLVFVYVVKPLGQLSRPYTVTSVRRVGLKLWELVIAPRKGRVPAFRAGQFVWLNVGNSPFSLKENPFSIASSPRRDDELRFVIKEVGDFTGSVGAIAPGTRAHVDGPHGDLVLEGRRADRIALIAGGVGIAPMLSILRRLDDDRDPRPVTLLYGNRCAEQIVHGDELEAMAGRIDLRVVHVLTEPPEGWTGRTGVIDEGCLRDVLGAREDGGTLHIICGPAPMIDAVETDLARMGVPTRQIISERFTYD
jgi:predicted ferric reductase